MLEEEEEELDPQQILIKFRAKDVAERIQLEHDFTRPPTKNLGRRKVRKRLGQKESRVVEDRLHKIARSIVNDAEERNAFIAYGNLKRIRNQEGKGRKFNDKLHKFPFSKLAKFIEYKAEERGILTLDVPEANTSKTCNRCGSTDATRLNQGRFIC